MTSPTLSADRVLVSLIKKYARGKSFVDIGCMWGVNGLFSFVAELCGARQVIAVDINRQTPEFLKEKKRRQSKIKFVRGDINLSETIDKIGLADIVFCSGVLYHTPDPCYLLSRLRIICKDILILNTCLIPEIKGIQNAAIFYPFLDRQHRKLWNFFDIKTTRQQKPVSLLYRPDGDYANWFWGFSPSCVKAMLTYAGFKINRFYRKPFGGCFVCRVN